MLGPKRNKYVSLFDAKEQVRTSMGDIRRGVGIGSISHRMMADYNNSVASRVRGKRAQALVHAFADGMIQAFIDERVRFFYVIDGIPYGTRETIKRYPFVKHYDHSGTPLKGIAASGEMGYFDSRDRYHTFGNDSTIHG